MDASLNLTYLSSKEAARLTGYVADYVTRLCRSERLKAKRVGRSWLIEHASLEQFVEEDTRRKEENARELAKVREEEYRQAKAARESRLVDALPALLSAATAATASSVVAFDEDTSSPNDYYPLRGSFVALAVTLAVLTGGLYLGQQEIRASFVSSVEYALDQVAINVVSTTKDGSIVAPTHVGILQDSLAGLPQMQGIGHRSKPDPTVDLLGAVSASTVTALTALGHTLVVASDTVLLTYQHAITWWVEETPQVPELVITSVYQIGHHTAAFAASIPEYAPESFAEAQDAGLGLIGYAALAYDSVRDTLVSAYEYAPVTTRELARAANPPQQGHQAESVLTPASGQIAAAQGAVVESGILTSMLGGFEAIIDSISHLITSR